MILHFVPHLMINMSRVMRKPTLCLCENKDADQLRGNREADQRLCFRYLVQYLFFLNTKFQASSHLQWLYSLVCFRPGQNPHCWFSHVAAHIHIMASLLVQNYDMSRVIRKADFWGHIRKQRCRSAYQRLCFHYTDSAIPLLPKYEISSL